VASLTLHEDKGAVLSHKAFGEQELDRFFDRLPTKPHTVWTSPESKPK
jgi:hypothetical protein